MSGSPVRLNDFAKFGKAALTGGVLVKGLGSNVEQRVSPVVAKAQVQPKGRTARPDPSGLNQSEARYMKHLAGRVQRREIAGYWPHALKFRLADKTWYTPDALVMLNDGLLELHELKGWMEDDAAVKLKVTAEAYWLFPVRLVKEKPRGVFTIREVGR